MESQGNGSPDDIVFSDEGSFYDPDDRAEERGPDENGELDATVGAASQEGRPADDRGDDRQPKRRRRRRRRSRRGGGGGDSRDFQRTGSGGPHGQRAPRRAPEQNGQYDGPEREGAQVLGTIEGALELHPKAYGFLRDPKNNYASGKNDPFGPASL